MNFRNVAQLSDQVLDWSRRLPDDIDLIVGIPRSGLLVANLLALYRNLPFTDVDGLLAGRHFGSGLRMSGEGVGKPLDDFRHILIVDDSLHTGGAMERCKKSLAEAGVAHNASFGAVYVQPYNKSVVDYYCEVLNQPRIFEWNVLHHPRSEYFCFDLDGVFCRDPTDAENDDGANYEAFINNVPPRYIPDVTLGWIVTSRLEKYRRPTESWLARAGIRYENLIMLDYPDAATRRSFHSRSAFKAEVYRETGAQLFVESSLTQSFEIANLAGRDVLCIATMQMVRPGSSPLIRPLFRADDVHPPSRSRAAARRVLPRSVRKRISNLTGGSSK